MLQQAGEKTLLDALARVFADVSPPREMRERARTAVPFIRRKFRSTTKQFGRERMGGRRLFSSFCHPSIIAFCETIR
ncbi:hypothetical protein [Burkholderia seminalis]|uniref:hypothetical protein n=1 Tax=Burkholderia seminalis TaxID=488731 RepID=UPI000F5A1E8D|nr:hypothetical protein [Burkholderia seminalis]